MNEFTKSGKHQGRRNKVIAGRERNGGDQNHWSRAGWVRGRVAVCAAGHGSRTFRNEAGALHPGSSDAGFCGTGLLKLTEIRKREYRSVAAEGRDATRRVVAPSDCARMRGSGRTRA